MLDVRRYEYRSTFPSKQVLEKTGDVIADNLAEMQFIAQKASAEKSLLAGADKYRLLYFGSLLYDFYLLTEDSLLAVARITDKWIPGSLDWHERLLKLMQSPIEDKRPPVISSRTAYLLADYLNLYLHFHDHCSKLSVPRIEKMVTNLKPLYTLLEKELTHIRRLLIPESAGAMRKTGNT